MDGNAVITCPVYRGECKGRENCFFWTGKVCLAESWPKPQTAPGGDKHDRS
jgi:hypothetical protein